MKRVEREAPANTVLEQDPAASPPGDEAALDCAFLTFFCSKPEVTLTVSTGPGSGKVPATAGLEPAKRRPKSSKRPASRPRSKRPTPTEVEEGLVIHSEPSGGTTATNGSTVTLVVSTRPEAGQGAGPGRQPAAPRGAADPRPRPHPQRLRRRKRLARRRGDQPVAERRQRGRSRARPWRSSSPPARKQAKVPNVIGKLRSEAVQAVREAGLEPDGRRRRNRSRRQSRPRDRPVPAAGLRARTGRRGDDRRRQAGQRRRTGSRRTVRVAVLCGGRSSEHDVSLRSGASVAARPARRPGTRWSR